MYFKANVLVDGFIFVGTNFRGLNKTYTFVGFKIRGHSIFFYNSYKKVKMSWVLEFVDRTLHENHEYWYPTKFKPFTVYVILQYMDSLISK